MNSRISWTRNGSSFVSKLMRCINWPGAHNISGNTYIMGISIYTHKTEVLSQHTSRHNIGGEDKPIGLTILVCYQVRYPYCLLLLSLCVAFCV